MNPSIFNSQDVKKTVFQNIVYEKYQISKEINTSYLDVGNISVPERKLILSFMKRDVDKIKEQSEKARKQRNKKG